MNVVERCAEAMHKGLVGTKLEACLMHVVPCTDTSCRDLEASNFRGDSYMRRSNNKCALSSRAEI
ncbi:hypothetical protein BDQ12DRAFT_77148 [Crucibulum laeve]|uniref:Uncharacterized protein n=1 Tax=Crucibulum laeve TaxID=68775 RepID=A0A5C3M2F0_9AGAR|nr:hypothetical protein BDQ12DRAFT_77148 [Crucibulum laeve]